MDTSYPRYDYPTSLPDYLDDSLLSVIDPLDKTMNFLAGHFIYEPVPELDPLVQDPSYPYTGGLFQDDFSLESDHHTFEVSPISYPASTCTSSPDDDHLGLSPSMSQYISIEDMEISQLIVSSSSACENADRPHPFSSIRGSRRASSVPKVLEMNRFMHPIDMPTRPVSACDQQSLLSRTTILPVNVRHARENEVNNPGTSRRRQKQSRPVSEIDSDGDDDNDHEWKPPSRSAPKRRRQVVESRRGRKPPSRQNDISCDQCQETFSRDGDKRRHQETVHNAKTAEEIFAETDETKRRFCMRCRDILSRVDARIRHEKSCKKKRRCT
ncbi:hypothetical protein BDQ17DRAFT_1427064 [Cyathus striatus]|nr:hypothetical protein BDQ17DRAFT_1427064 [Cyathus striatus]